eukprot:5016651-Pleurochrysis_carterae.AAC.4
MLVVADGDAYSLLIVRYANNECLVSLNHEVALITPQLLFQATNSAAKHYFSHEFIYVKQIALRAKLLVKACACRVNPAEKNKEQQISRIVSCSALGTATLEARYESGFVGMNMYPKAVLDSSQTISQRKFG